MTKRFFIAWALATAAGVGTWAVLGFIPGCAVAGLAGFTLGFLYTREDA